VGALTQQGTRRTVETANGVLHYHEAGTGAPLLLLHGSGPGVSGWANFAGNLPTFAERFRTLVLDLPGFGGSPAPEDGHPLLSAPGAVVAFLDALGLDRAAILGNSMGGGVATTVAATHPERVARLAAIGGIGVSVLNPIPSEGIRTLVEFVEQPTREALVRWIQSMLYDQSFLTDELVAERWAQANAPGALEWMRKMYSSATLALLPRIMAGADGPPPWLALSKIQAPTLLLWGRDDRVSPLDMSLLPLRMIARCDLHVFSRCGHWVMVERKEEFERVAMAFFDRPDDS
jgi:pimeloyl-ACP methyl ester carboxylesterase